MIFEPAREAPRPAFSLAGARRRPSFSAEWEEGMKENKTVLQRGLSRRPQLRQAPRGRPRFTLAKQEIFFAELAATCNVSAAYRKAGVSHYCVYDHRRKSAAFRARWAEAVREAYARLELMMLDRAMNGTVKTRTRADGSVEKIHEYPNHIAMQLLRLHRATAAEAEEVHDSELIEEARDRLANRLERLRRRIEGETADAGGKVFVRPEGGGLPM
jgi:hypothetical protein